MITMMERCLVKCLRSPSDFRSPSVALYDGVHDLHDGALPSEMSQKSAL